MCFCLFYWKLETRKHILSRQIIGIHTRASLTVSILLRYNLQKLLKCFNRKKFKHFNIIFESYSNLFAASMSRAHCLSFQYSQTGSDCGNQMSFTVLILILDRYKVDIKFQLSTWTWFCSPRCRTACPSWPSCCLLHHCSSGLRSWSHPDQGGLPTTWLSHFLCLFICHFFSCHSATGTARTLDRFYKYLV